MVEFFQKMGKLSRAGGEGPPEYLRTHPVSVSRISEAENRAMNMSDVTPRDGRNFYLAPDPAPGHGQGRPPSKSSISSSRRRERADIHETEYDAIDYGTAIALQRTGQV